ncbi:MAG: peptidoglycan-associated lipoprotein Pal [Pseudomonadota bacterium]
MTRNTAVRIVTLISALWLAGCATDKGAPPVEDPAQTQGVGTPGPVEGAPLPAKDSKADLLAKKRVHFAFDSSTIDEESRAIIEAHAAHLNANPQLKVKLEGHCDERGTREYNLALGERRAKTVERLLRVMGVAANRITTNTYGEEKPLDPEHNESAWRLNRRVELIY